MSVNSIESFSFGDTTLSSSVVNEERRYDVIVRGRVSEVVDSGSAWYMAASPPDYMTNFSGSGLPFPSKEHAFSNTPNKGPLTLGHDGSFEIRMYMPNSYYADFNGTLVSPYVIIGYTTGGQERSSVIQLSQHVPYRTLTYPEKRTSPMFYDKDLPVRTQEQILRDGGYPMSLKQNTADFWGLKPPHP